MNFEKYLLLSIVFSASVLFIWPNSFYFHYLYENIICSFSFLFIYFSPPIPLFMLLLLFIYTVVVINVFQEILYNVLILETNVIFKV